MPRQAVALKKYRCGTSPVSKISDNEDATAALWYSGKLCVEHSVGCTVPEFLKSGQEASESMAFDCVVAILDHDLFPVSGSVTGVQVDFRWTRIGSVVGKAAENSGHVLPDNPAGPCTTSKLEKLERQVATVIAQSASEAGDAEGLAGRASDKKVNWPIFVSADFGEVATKRNLRVMMGKDGARRRLYLGEAQGLPTERLPCRCRGADTRADIDVFHAAAVHS